MKAQTLIAEGRENKQEVIQATRQKWSLTQTAFDGLRRATGITAVFVTHDLHEAALLADRVAVLRRGRIEQVAPPSELVTRPATDYVRDLLARARMVGE